MRGRMQAVAVTCLSAGTVFFYWLGAAAVALVALRKGLAEGAVVLLWSLIPALVILYYGNSFFPLTVLLGTFACAAVLRLAVVWSLALVCASVAGLIAGLILVSFEASFVEAFQQAVNGFLGQWQSQMAEQGNAVELPRFTVAAATGFVALSSAMLMVLCLVLARYWQAALYNPGGFREEFHALRLPPMVALPLAVLVVACYSQGLSGAPWAYLAGLPLIMAGISLAHKWVATKKMNSAWLGLFYFMLVFVGPSVEITMLAGLLDSWMNFRARFAASKDEQ